MKVSSENIADRQVVLNIEVDPEEVEGSLERAYRRLVQRAKIPGFRKGKAPRTMLERYLGRGALLEEALNHLAPEVTTRAIREHTLDAIAEPQIEIMKIDPVVIKATVSLKPTVELGDYSQLRLTWEPAEVKEEQINSLIEQIREGQTPWEPVERPLAFGDMAVIDVEGEVEGKKIINQKGASYIVLADSKMPVEGFSQKLEGMQKGENREFALSFPGDSPNKELAEKTCAFKVAVLEVKERHLPELNDDFARGLGQGFESMDAFRKKVEEDLKAAAEREAKRRFEEKALEATVGMGKVEFPPVLVEKETDRMIMEQAERLAQRGINFDVYLKSTGKTGEELREELKPAARRRVINSLVMGKIAELEKVSVSASEIEAEIEAMAKDAGEKGEEVRKFFSSQEAIRSLERVLLTRKTLERLTTLAKTENTPTEDVKENVQPTPADRPTLQ